MSRTRQAALVLAFLACPAVAAAQATALAVGEVRAPARREGEARDLAAGRASGRLVADGRLDEGAWAAAVTATDFTQIRPRPGAAASAPTVAGVLVDADALWIGIRLEEPDPRGPMAVLGRRDAELPGDWVTVLVDSYHDRRTAFRFAVNAAGVVQDGLVSNDNEFQEDRGWNAVWESAVRREERAWIVELRIPLTQLRFSGSGDSTRTLGLQLLRDRARANERSSWSPMPPAGAGFVSRFGTLSDVRMSRVPRRLEVLPYAVLRQDHVPVAAGDPVTRADVAGATLGADVQAGLTPDLTLTATIRPDFGQVEADPSEVNLSGFETFFPEQRPFFMEGADLFRVPVLSAPWVFGRTEQFYSRRIGRRPQGQLPDGAEWDETPGATRVLGAAKLTGRTAGWMIGALDAVTADERATWAGADGASHRSVVEPLTNYAMLRAVRQSADGWRAVGGTLTATHRRLTPSTEALLRRDAWVGTVDARRRWDADHEVAVTASASRVRGSPEAIARTQRSIAHLYQRPDAAYLDYDTSRTALGGALLDARVSRTGGPLRWGVVASMITPGYEANDMGFLASADQRSAGGWIGVLHYEPWRWLQGWESWTNVSAQWTTNGDRKLASVQQYVELQGRTGWQLGVEVAHRLPALSVGALRGGPALAQPAFSSLWSQFSSDPRRAVSAQLTGFTMRARGAPDALWRVQPALRIRPTPALDLAVEPTYTRARVGAQYVDDAVGGDGATRWVVGSLRQQTLATGVRASYTLSPRLGVQLWAQPFASAGRFGTLREVRAARAARFAERFDSYDASRARRTDDGWSIDRDADGAVDFTLDDPDFHVRELRANSVVRWEFRPGSTLFLVWTQQREADEAGRFGALRDARALLATRPRNTVLAKVSWWMRA